MFETLPKDIALHILSYLPFSYRIHTLTFVSKKFYSLVHSTPSFRFTATKSLKKLNDILSLIQKQFPHVIHIEVYDCVTPVIVKLENCKFSEIHLIGSKQVKTFEMPNCRLNFLNLRGCRRLKQIKLSCDTLKYLCISQTLVDDEELEKLIKRCKNLNTVIAKQCLNLKNPVIKSECITYLNFRSCSNLQNLELSCPLKQLILHGTSVTDKSVFNIVSQVCHSLQYLELRKCTHLQFKNLEMLNKCIHLETLNFCDTQVSEAFVHEVVSKLKELVTLDISWCMNLKKIVVKHEKLKYLYLDYSKNVTELQVICPKLIKCNTEHTGIQDDHS